MNQNRSNEVDTGCLDTVSSPLSVSIYDFDFQFNPLVPVSETVKDFSY